MLDTARWTVLAPLLQAATAGRDLLVEKGRNAEEGGPVFLRTLG